MPCLLFSNLLALVCLLEPDLQKLLLQWLLRCHMFEHTTIDVLVVL